MATCDDDQLDKNALLFLAVREKINVSEKLMKVNRCLEAGGNINATDANYFCNAPIHMAVMRAETDIVKLLIDKGASLVIKNSNGKTPIDLARELNSDKRHELITILQATGCHINKPTIKIQEDVQSNNGKPTMQSKQVPKSKKPFRFSKRTGTSGVCGQLYETKLLSLVLMRALNDKDIEKFHLGTNINGIGDLDDICLRYEVKGHPRPIMVFLQAKHREDRDKGRLTVEDLTNVSGDFSLRKYFDSYLKIKSHFQPNNEDDLFDGEFNNVEMNIIIYTPARECFTKKRIDKTVSIKVNQLINTIKNVEDEGEKNVLESKKEYTEPFQFDFNDNDLDYLTKMAVEKRLVDLASEFLYLIMSKNKLQVIMASELIARYHAVMRREILQMVKIQIENQEYREWKFHPDFFDTGSDYLEVIRMTFYNELSTSIYDKSDIGVEDRINLEAFITSSNASNLSKLISKILTFDGKKLQLKETSSLKKLFPGNNLQLLKANLNNIEIPGDIVREAIKTKLQSLTFKLPIAFGNLDMTIRGNAVKVQETIVRVVEKLKPLFKMGNKTIEINDHVVGPKKLIEEGVINIFGTAVGNLLVFDVETKMLMFDIDNTDLPTKSKLLLGEFKKHFSDNELRSYRISVNKNKFPKDSFHGDEYDKRLAREFLEKLWFYADQAKEDEVEKIVKKGIKKYYNSEKDQNRFTFRIQSDAIFLRSHDDVQKWWMSSGKQPYLTRETEFFEKAKQAVIDNPLLTILDSMYNLKVHNMDIKFNEGSIRVLELHTMSEKLINIITEANMLTGIKVMQFYEKQEKCTFIDFDYVLSLPLADYNKMLQELEKLHESHTLIIVYEKLKYYEGLCNKLIQVIKQFSGNKVILVTDSELASEIKTTGCFEDYQSVTDDSTYLIDLDEASKIKLLKESTIVFQGEERTLKEVLQKNAQSLVRTDILQKIVQKQKLEIGHELSDDLYKEIKDSYIERTLTLDETHEAKTLINDIKDKVVVVTGRPGMGKSALLTHLSLQTKLVQCLPWIVRVNLPNYEKEFSRWQKLDIKIDLPLVLYFLSKIATKNIDIAVKFELTHHDGRIILSKVDENIDALSLFELELFLLLYNNGEVIFLFDDFNAMCPHHEKEVLEMLKLLRDADKRIWIMTCDYRHTRMALENEFGTPYKLDCLNNTEKKTLLERFFRNNIRLERLNYDQFENVKSFMKFMSKFSNRSLVNDPDRELIPLFSLTFHLIYVLAVKFFQSEINRASPAVFRKKIKQKFEIDLEQYSLVDEVLGRNVDDEELELAGTPLHLYLAANYFKCRLEDSISFLLDEREARSKWDFIHDTFTLYRNFVEAHMRKIFNKEETDDDSIVYSFRKTRREFFDKNKKLGLFALCKENDLNKILKQDEIDEIKDIIAKIKSGEDRSTLVNCVVDDVPRFAHLVFAEYFAVEYLTDIMKGAAEDCEIEDLFKFASLWQSLLNILLFNGPPGLRKAFDYKLHSDCTLAKLANSDVCREVMFELLLKSNRSSETNNEPGPSTRETPIQEAMADGLVNVVNLFLSSAQGKLHRGNVDDFLNLLKRSGEKFIEFGKEYTETLSNILKSVENMDLKALGAIFSSGKLTEVPLKHVSDYCNSETASELQRHVEATVSHVPALTHHVQQLVQETGSVGEVAKALLETGLQRAMEDILKRLQEE